MADIQTLSGLAILISGFISMSCGLSAFHWQIIVYLAWFSSLTHLAVLTFLRQRLYHWRPMRAWRLIAMAVLMLLLMVALVPTARFDWPPADAFESPAAIFDTTLVSEFGYPDTVFAPNRYAVCSFKHMGKIEATSLVPAAISMVVIFSSFVTRVVKLHKTLSDALGVIRLTVGRKYIAALDQLHSWTHDCSEPPEILGSVHGRWKKVGVSLVRSLAYQPACAMFIAIRTAIDAFTSTFYEVRSRSWRTLGGSLVDYANLLTKSDPLARVCNNLGDGAPDIDSKLWRRHRYLKHHRRQLA